MSDKEINPAFLKPSHDDLKLLSECLEVSHNSPSGLIWKNRPLHHFKHSQSMNVWNSQHSGKPAGTIRTTKSRHKVRKDWVMKFKGSFLVCARVIWSITNGQIPEGLLVDHENCEPLDNRIENLRLVTYSQNRCNSPKRGGCSSDLKGASFSNGRWISSICLDGKKVSLGSFDNEEDAHLAYAAASKKLHGEFSKV